MVQWQQTLVPALIFYVLATFIALGVAAMIAGLASLLGKLESRSENGGK